MKGLDLSRGFFLDVIEPVIENAAPGLKFAAGLVGDGSEVLGLDDDISSDHDFGPRLLLFLQEKDFEAVAPVLMAEISSALPVTYAGWATHFADLDRPPSIDASAGAAGCPDHGVEIYTLRGWTLRQLGLDLSRRSPNISEWAVLDEQKLLTVVEGEVFRDDANELSELRLRLEKPPLDVRLKKIADLWDSISEETAFVGRAGHVGDELGSRLIAGRITEQLMRICFLIEGRYPPYSKWFGTAWARLPGADDIAPHLWDAQLSEDWRAREAAIGAAGLAVARLHAARGLPGDLKASVGPYFGRPYTVINADRIGRAIRDAAEARHSGSGPVASEYQS